MLIKKSSLSRGLTLKYGLLFMLTCAALFLPPLFSTAAGQSVDLSPEFCANIQEVLESGQDKFKAIRGKLDLVSEEYFGSLVPEGLEECFGWLDGKAYHCRSREGFSLDEAAKRYDAYNQMLRECLGNRWHSKEVTVDRVNGRRITSYKSDSTPITIQLRERSQRHGWFVDFYFRRSLRKR